MATICYRPIITRTTIMGISLGVGIDLWSFFLDTRMEYGANRLVSSPGTWIGRQEQDIHGDFGL
jgi:hypothetical protein